MALLPNDAIPLGTTQDYAGDCRRREKHRLEIITLVFGPAKVCGDQIFEPLLSSGIGKGLGHLFRGAEELNKDRAPRPFAETLHSRTCHRSMFL